MLLASRANRRLLSYIRGQATRYGWDCGLLSGGGSYLDFAVSAARPHSLPLLPLSHQHYMRPPASRERCAKRHRCWPRGRLPRSWPDGDPGVDPPTQRQRLDREYRIYRSLATTSSCW